MNRTHGRRAGGVATVLVLAAGLAACGGDDDAAAPNTIKVWIQEELPDRTAASKAIAEEFTKQSGVEVDLVAVAEDQFDQLLLSSAAAGDLPDVIGNISLPQVRTLSAHELLDTEAIGAVLRSLDESTFSERAIELVSDGETRLAVPSDSWLQMLFYRADLFEEAGLEEPSSYDAILAAAETLHSDDMVGFVGANAPGDAFTEQTFEHVALGNGCEMVDEDGEVGMASDECVEALEFYGTLVEDWSVSGAQDVDTTRASYFAGQAAMFIWSSFALDELAGLRNDALPNCPECEGDPRFLPDNTGVVTTIEGPGGDEPAAFGEVASWVVTAEARTENASRFVEYMLTDGYLPWISIAPEGKVPVRLGTPRRPSRFSDAWKKLEVGVDKKAPLSEFYDAAVLEALAAGPEQLSRWAIPQGQGDVLGAVQGEQPVATAVNEVTTGGDPREAAEDAAETIESIAESLS